MDRQTLRQRDGQTELLQLRQRSAQLCVVKKVKYSQEVHEPRVIIAIYTARPQIQGSALLSVPIVFVI